MDPTATPTATDIVTATVTAIATPVIQQVQVMTGDGIDAGSYMLWIILTMCVVFAFTLGMWPWLMSAAGRWRR